MRRCFELGVGVVGESSAVFESSSGGGRDGTGSAMRRRPELGVGVVRESGGWWRGGEARRRGGGRGWRGGQDYKIKTKQGSHTPPVAR
jgi:hypothetical protein